MTEGHTASPEDLAFARSLETYELAPEAFDHAAHVRLAYVYLCESPVDSAAERMKDSLLGYLDHLGVGHGKYHETITRAWIMAVSHFMNECSRCQSAADFMSRNPSLLNSRIMLTHYSAHVLFSAKARQEFVHPDISPIPQH